MSARVSRCREHVAALRREWLEGDDDEREAIGALISELAQPAGWRSMTELADQALEEAEGDG